jgi:hypothetical protein
MNEKRIARKFGATALVALLLGGGVLLGVPAATAFHKNCHEDHDGIAPFSASGELTNANPVDIYEIIIQADDVIAIDIENAPAGEDLSFIVSTQGSCVPLLIGPSVVGSPDVILSEGIFWLRLNRTLGTDVEYTITMQQLGTPIPDCTSEEAKTTPFSDSGTLTSTNLDDRYKITVPSGVSQIAITPETSDINFTLSRELNDDCVLVLFGATSMLLIDMVLSPGEWFLKLERTDPMAGSVNYDLVAS